MEQALQHSMFGTEHLVLGGTPVHPIPGDLEDEQPVNWGSLKAIVDHLIASYGFGELIREIWAQSSQLEMKVVGGLPMPKLQGDVGYNLHSTEEVVLKPGSYAQIRTGVKVQLPVGTWGLVLPRSSANRSGALVVLPGVIDNGFRGEMTAMVHHVKGSWMRRAWNWMRGKSETITVKNGEALAQLVVMPMLVPQINRVVRLDDSDRGENGYGSTGAGVQPIA